ncbi:hypothetical protein ACI3K5_23690 [Streptomyces sp. MPA0124]|uniref:hypothetical protein n=1 Tax=unclassified Streptomyces TaxID=2593676 RepID=UPI0037FE229E
MTVPAYTKAAGGFVAAHSLPDGRFLVEGWHLNLQPFDATEPRHDIHYEHIAATSDEAAKTVAEFVRWLDKPLNAAS